MQRGARWSIARGFAGQDDENPGDYRLLPALGDWERTALSFACGNMTRARNPSEPPWVG